MTSTPTTTLPVESANLNKSSDIAEQIVHGSKASSPQIPHVPRDQQEYSAEEKELSDDNQDDEEFEYSDDESEDYDHSSLIGRGQGDKVTAGAHIITKGANSAKGGAVKGDPVKGGPIKGPRVKRFDDGSEILRLDE